MISPKKCPAYEHGRWYELLVESDGTNYALTSSDIPGELTFGSNYLKLPLYFHVVDVKLDIDCLESVSSLFSPSIKFAGPDTIGIGLPGKAAFDWIKIYVFGYFAG